MAVGRDYVALDWVSGEINATLDEACRALEAFVADQQDTTRLRFCLSYVHQVQGTLRMVEFHGAALLAREIELLGQALLAGEIDDSAEALEALMAALLQLPPYLQRVRRARSDLPESLLAMINELRAVRGGGLLSESALFSPRLHATTPSGPQSPRLQAEEFEQLIRKLRQLFQTAFVGIIRNKQLGQHLDNLAGVCERLLELSKGRQREPLWKIALAVIEGLANQSIVPNAAVKSLLKEIDSELKGLLHRGEAFFDEAVSSDLLKNFLYYVARSEADSPLIVGIKEEYGLQEALDASRGGASAGADPQAMQSVVRALIEELSGAKDLLDLYVRSGSGRGEIAKLSAALPVIKRIADTMAVLGLTAPLNIARAQEAVLQRLVEQAQVAQAPEELDAAALLQVAAALIEVEQALLSCIAQPGAEVAVPHHLDEARQTVAREARHGLEQAKEAIVQFVASQWDRTLLQAVPRMLAQIQASLNVAHFRAPAKVLGACRRYVIDALLAQEQVPRWQDLDTLADALSSVDYHLERLLEDSQDDDCRILGVAADSVARLGYAIDGAGAEPARAEAMAAGAEPELPDGDGEALGSPEAYPVPAAVNTEVAGAVPPQPGVGGAVAIEEAVEDIRDDDIAEILAEEAAEVLESIQEALPRWCADPADEEALSVLRRGWHTLKGSGRMVGANCLGELAWSIECMLNRIIDQTLEASPPRQLLVAKVTAMVPPLVAALSLREPVNKAYVDWVISLADALMAQDEGSAADPAAIDAALVQPALARAHNDAIAVRMSQPAVEVSVAAVDVPASANEAGGNVAGQSLEEEPSAARDPDLAEIFAGEAEGHLEIVLAFIEEAQSSAQPLPVSDALQRALHTLKGSANMAGVALIARVVTPLEGLVKQLQLSGVRVDAAILAVLRDTTRLLYIALNYLREGTVDAEFAELDGLLARIAGLARDHAPKAAQAGDDTDYLARAGAFMHETADALQQLLDILQQWRRDGGATAVQWRQMVDSPAAIAAAARALELDEVAQLAERWMQAASRLEGTVPGASAVDAFTRAHSALECMLDAMAADQAVDPVDVELASALAVLGGDAPADDAAADVPAPPAGGTVPPLATSDASIEAAAGEEAEQVDDEIVEIFLEEARDLLENIDNALHEWQADREDLAQLALLQRLLHTLKGSARLTGLRRLGDLSHDFETFLIESDAAGSQYDAAFFAQLQRHQDLVTAAVDAFVVRSKAPEPTPAQVAAPLRPSELLESTEFISIDVAAAVATAADHDAGQAGQAHETVKLPAQLIDGLVNLAGETSINRARVEEQINELIFALAEMDSTIDRMQEQLRRLDIETEAQLIFRQEQVESLGLEEFDPLEMDRYSVLQQLSRSLMESSSDIQEVKRGIFNRARDIETLLLQQARVNTDLQEGLMRSRMVPFSRSVPRLRRIVRQVSMELDKQVNLVLHNIDGEMDRTVLERMVPPFEHMLRNSVDHGIEDAAARVAAGKSPMGRIEISFRREAGDVVITLQDDGKGIDLRAVRAKAVERGLLREEIELEDHEIAQFIMQPGFSTAQSVTQISGRGVGMDVVASEIKQLGGSVEIDTTLGRGTRFIIRLPFTVSVNRALMVRACNEDYALPLNTIEGIVRVSPFELESYYQPGGPLFEYAGQAYELRYMGSMIGKRAVPDLQSETMPLPVILVRSGDHAVAVQVDSLLSSREIVVKTLGTQFAAVPGLSGATVLGDGSVVLILDLHAMVRTDFSSFLEHAEHAADAAGDSAREHRNLLVMVVDDSVTVRKVTSRFLERNGMDVLLAKDGVDAIQLLQEHSPDVMLLDIEMPRMDGFEVAARVKHSSRLKNLPIIMITSRTGDKHRERAHALGVDRYLGKPYQEIELLRNIEELAGVLA